MYKRQILRCISSGEVMARSAARVPTMMSRSEDVYKRQVVFLLQFVVIIYSATPSFDGESTRLCDLQNAEVGQQVCECPGLGPVTEDSYRQGVPAHIDDVGPEDVGPVSYTHLYFGP